MAAYLVVRMRGTVNIPHWARTTLTNLNLNKKFRATIVPENSQTLGMLRKVKDIVAWSSVDAGFITELIEKKGRKIGYKPINVSDLPIEYNSINDLAAAIAENRILMTKIKDFKPWFALSPPKGGFKRKSKTQYSQKGILGENHELPQLVKTML